MHVSPVKDYQESMTTGQTHIRTDRQTPDKVIPMCRYASQATQKYSRLSFFWKLNVLFLILGKKIGVSSQNMTQRYVHIKNNLYKYLYVSIPRALPLKVIQATSWLFGWLLGIYVALAVFQPYHDLEAGDNQSLKFKWRGGESNPGPLAPQAKSLTTRPQPLLQATSRSFGNNSVLA